MTNLTERRRVAENTLNRLTAQREGLITSLVRIEGRLKDARRKLERSKRAMQKALIKHTEEWHQEQAKPEPAPVPEPEPTVDDSDLVVAQKLLNAINNDGIPALLDRRTLGGIDAEVEAANRRIAESKRKDDEARAKIEADRRAAEKTKREVAAEKRKVRAEKLNAKLTGASKAMPLTGRAALEAIRRKA